MKKLVLIISLLAYSIIGFCQGKKYHDTSEVVSTILNELDNNGKIIYVFENLNPSVLKEFQFKNVDNYLVGGQTFALYKDSLWNSFLMSIDIDIIPVNCSLVKALQSPSLKIIKKGEKFIGDPESVYGTITLSPIIFSKDFKKAIITMEKIRSTDSHSTTIYFLEKKDKKWLVKQKILLRIT